MKFKTDSADISTGSFIVVVYSNILFSHRAPRQGTLRSQHRIPGGGATTLEFIPHPTSLYIHEVRQLLFTCPLFLIMSLLEGPFRHQNEAAKSCF